MPPTTKKKKKTGTGKPKKTITNIIAALNITDSTTGLPASWVCGNHAPAHSATSVQEIVDKTKELGCINWRTA